MAPGNCGGLGVLLLANQRRTQTQLAVFGSWGNAKERLTVSHECRAGQCKYLEGGLCGVVRVALEEVTSLLQERFVASHDIQLQVNIASEILPPSIDPFFNRTQSRYYYY